LYEELITEDLAARLRALDDRLEPRTDELRGAEAGDRIAHHLAGLIHRAITSLRDEERVKVGIALARSLVSEIEANVKVDLALDAPVEPGTVLRAILGRQPDGRSESISEPLIPLLDTALLTNAPGEPRVGSQLLAEIRSADRIDVVMAFICRTGIGPLLAALEAHCHSGRPLRILTTTYTGTTEKRALDDLRAIGADVRVSYDTSTTRLHAKAWLFHRSSGFSTTYIGSSNLTHSAQVTGLE
jgi:hypothetical protein